MEHASFRNFLAAVIKAARLRNGLSQDELSEKAGLSKRFITRIENGHQEMLLSNIFILAKAMGESPMTLIGQLEYAMSNGALPASVASGLPEKKRGRPKVKAGPAASAAPKMKPGRPAKVKKN